MAPGHGRQAVAVPRTGRRSPYTYPEGRPSETAGGRQWAFPKGHRRFYITQLYAVIQCNSLSHHAWRCLKASPANIICGEISVYNALYQNSARRNRETFRRHVENRCENHTGSDSPLRCFPAHRGPGTGYRLGYDTGMVRVRRTNRSRAGMDQRIRPGGHV